MEESIKLEEGHSVKVVGSRELQANVYRHFLSHDVILVT